jgi:hypothetical protein
MSSTRRLLLIVGVIVIAGLGFIFAKASNDDDEQFPQETVSGFTTAPSTTSGGTAADSAARTQPLEHVPLIVVRGLRPAGGIERMTFHTGDTIRFEVTSDRPEEVHFHGYDVARDVTPASPARFAVPAKIEGVFEVELEHSGTQIASITVEP